MTEKAIADQVKGLADAFYDDQGSLMLHPVIWKNLEELVFLGSRISRSI